MPTFQSPRSPWRRYNCTLGAHARRRAALDAARIAGPAPVYPEAAPVHGDWIGGRINGHTVIVRLVRQPWHRCDQWAAEIDGEVIAQAAGLTTLWDALHKRWPRALSLRAIATLRA